MFDGSSHPLRDNIAESCRLVEVAHAVGATLEAEVGVIAGKENVGVALIGRIASEVEVEEFVAAVEPDLFAPAIGTIHGRRGGAAKIAWEQAERFGRMFSGPLVLHGTTGLPKADIRQLVGLGYRKVNYATAVRDAFVSGMSRSLSDPSDLPRPQGVLVEGRKEVRRLIDHILDDFGLIPTRR
jgi:fructose-bisphosphate aldolase class II